MNRHNVSEVLRDGKALLKFAGIESWSLDAELLMMECFGFTRTQLLSSPETDIPEGEALERYKSYLRRRSLKEPVQYILNRCEFMSLPLYVNGNVLIPRPDTEILVEKAIDIIMERGYKNILEVGTGSGCISVSLAYYIKDISIMANDKSLGAVEVAKKNAKKHGVEDRINFTWGDCLRTLDIMDGIYDFVVSNPPYIPKAEIEALDNNVKDYEPLMALDGGEDGLKFYRGLTSRLRNHIRPGGAAGFEIGYNQSAPVIEILEQSGFKKNYVFKDLSGQDRVIITEVE